MSEEENDIIHTIKFQSTLYNDFTSSYFSKYFLPELINNIVLCFLSKNNFSLFNNIIIIEIIIYIKKTGRNKNEGIFIDESETIININYTNKNNNESNDFIFCTAIKGKLLEVNKNIINNNNLIKEAPLSDIFICFFISGFERSSKT